MRIPVPVTLGLILASAIVSTVMWRQLRTERQLGADLRTELVAARLAPVTSEPEPVVVSLETAAAMPAPATVRSATDTLLADTSRRQKALMEDAEFRKARVAELRSNIQLRFPNLARDLELSPQEAEALLTLLAEHRFALDAGMNDRMAAGTNPDAATSAEQERVHQELEQRQKREMVALLGADRAKSYQEYEETAASRRRGVNVGEMLAQSGQPLTPAQSKSLTALLVAEQRQQESEVRALVDSGQTVPQQAERTIEGDRRVLAAAAGFLDAQQVELVRARFEQVAARTRASASVQQREVEAVVQQGGGD